MRGEKNIHMKNFVLLLFFSSLDRNFIFLPFFDIVDGREGVQGRSEGQGGEKGRSSWPLLREDFDPLLFPFPHLSSFLFFILFA